MSHVKEKATYSLSENKIARKALLGTAGLGVLLVVAWLLSSWVSGLSFGKSAHASTLDQSPKRNFTEMYVKLLGPDSASVQVATPHGTTYRYWGPVGTEVIFSDGMRVPVTADVGTKRGIFSFFGPKGDSVRVAWWDAER